jgi:hypothetical protein
LQCEFLLDVSFQPHDEQISQNYSGISRHKTLNVGN